MVLLGAPSAKWSLVFRLAGTDWGVGGGGHRGADGEEGSRRTECRGVEGCYVVRGWLLEPLCL